MLLSREEILLVSEGGVRPNFIEARMKFTPVQ
jgi:hypothetical protein